MPQNNGFRFSLGVVIIIMELVLFWWLVTLMLGLPKAREPPTFVFEAPISRGGSALAA